VVHPRFTDTVSLSKSDRATRVKLANLTVKTGKSPVSFTKKYGIPFCGGGDSAYRVKLKLMGYCNVGELMLFRFTSPTLSYILEQIIYRDETILAGVSYCPTNNFHCLVILSFQSLILMFVHLLRMELLRIARDLQFTVGSNILLAIRIVLLQT
jgi:hypothetical protein